MSNKIDNIQAEEILDSRGNPTMKVTVSSGISVGSFSVPSGASTGAHEAYELRDKDGKGVSEAIGNINNIIAPALIGVDAIYQQDIDEAMLKMDGTKNKHNLGGNAMIGVSVACARLGASVSKLETFEYLKTLNFSSAQPFIPYLYMNLINGGKHAKNGLAFQEYHVVPVTVAPKEAVEIGLKIQESLRQIITKNLGQDSLVQGDEGGFAPKISDVRTPLVYLSEAIKENNLEGQVRLALDVAATSFYKDNLYFIGEEPLSKEDLMALYNSLIKEFNLLSIEDPFQEEDFESFAELRANHPELIVVGDDLTVTNKDLLEKAIEHKSINGIIIKPNQIGTLTETIDTMKLAQNNNVKLIISHRSGETMDDFIADLAYASGAFGLKAGSPVAKERRIKYDRLVNITNK